MKTLYSILCLTVLAALSVQAGDMKKMEVGNIEHEALKKAIAEESVTLIDVNGTKSFKTGHIPGAIDFIAEKESLAAKLPADKNALIVAYCSNENCGAYMKGAKAAQKLGYTNVKHYSAGIMGWKEKEEVEKG